MHSTNYLYPLRQTTCRKLQNAMRERSFHVNEADIYRASEREALLRGNFPYQLPTNHLQLIQLIKVVNYNKKELLPVGQ